jgi:hypothetical protein
VLLTLPVKVPAPRSVPPCSAKVVAEATAPPFMNVSPAVCVKPLPKLTVPVCALTVPLLLKGTLKGTAPALVVLVTVPALLKRLVPPDWKSWLVLRISKVAPARLLKVPPVKTRLFEGWWTAVPELLTVRARTGCEPVMLSVAAAGMLVVPVPSSVPPRMKKTVGLMSAEPPTAPPLMLTTVAVTAFRVEVGAARDEERPADARHRAAEGDGAVDRGRAGDVVGAGDGASAFEGDGGRGDA